MLWQKKLMAFYHNLVTHKSWEELQKLNRLLDFILIGGWAVYLYSKALKSKDIDMIVDFDQLEELSKYYELTKNERLKKYEAKKDEVEIDIYLPYYSQIGIPVEDLIEKKQKVEGFTAITPTFLLVLKVYTLAQRRHTPKGKKDFLDAISLIKTGQADLKKLKKLITSYKLQKELDVFKEVLAEHFDLPELDINRHFFAKLKRKIL